MILSSFQCFQQGKLGKVEKVYLMGSDGGVLKMTGRAVITALTIVFSMKKIYSKCDGQKKKKKTYIKNSFSSILHFKQL